MPKTPVVPVECRQRQQVKKPSSALILAASSRPSTKRWPICCAIICVMPMMLTKSSIFALCRPVIMLVSATTCATVSRHGSIAASLAAANTPESFAIGAHVHLNADAVTAGRIGHRLHNHRAQLASATDLDFERLTTRSGNPGPHFVDHSDGMAVDAGDDVAFGKSRRGGGLTGDQLLHHRPRHPGKVDKEKYDHREHVVHDRSGGDGQKRCHAGRFGYERGSSAAIASSSGFRPAICTYPPSGIAPT